jgi:hypothetical protein
MKRLLIAGLASTMIAGSGVAHAFVSANTIDRDATYRNGGASVRVTGPIGCTMGERVSIQVLVTQAASGARGREAWRRRCTGEVQRWRVRAPTRKGARFEAGRARVCAVARTRSAHRLTDTRRWCERVTVSPRF